MSETRIYDFEEEQDRENWGGEDAEFGYFVVPMADEHMAMVLMDIEYEQHHEDRNSAMEEAERLAVAHPDAYIMVQVESSGR